MDFHRHIFMQALTCRALITGVAQWLSLSCRRLLSGSNSEGTDAYIYIQCLAFPLLTKVSFSFANTENWHGSTIKWLSAKRIHDLRGHYKETDTARCIIIIVVLINYSLLWEIPNHCECDIKESIEPPPNPFKTWHSNYIYIIILLI